jgi:hypothetical protein
MAWDNPVWTAEGITDDKLNTRIRDNMIALKDPPTDVDNFSYTGSHYTSFASSTWAAVTVFSVTLTTTGGDVFIWCNICTSSASTACYDFAVDGSRLGGNDGIIPFFTGSVSMVWLVQDLAAGEHTIELYAKMSSGTMNVIFYQVPQFGAREIS